MNQKDYYETLGVDRNATHQSIKEAYRKLAFQYHPDRNREDPAAVEKMKVVNEAYAVLSDPRKRRDYDTLRDQYGAYGYDRFKQSYSEQDIFRGSDINQIFEEMARGFGVRGFEEVFRESYGPGFRTFEFRRPGFFGRGFIFVGPGFRRGGRGEIPTSSEIFPGYLGKLTRYAMKKVLGIKSPEKGKDWGDVIMLDPEQARAGGRFRYFHKRRSKELVITIPPGIGDRQRIRLKGMGSEGKGGREAGDLYLQIQIRKPLLMRVREFLKI
jgi:DnaJ-class molecular chaperone